MIYYAHSMKIYNSKQECQELKWIQKKFHDVVNPNGDIRNYNSIEPYLKKVSECNSLIFSEYKKFIGKGVYEEIDWALSEKKTVQCLRKRWRGFYLVKVNKIEIADKSDWSIYYGNVVEK